MIISFKKGVQFPCLPFQLGNYDSVVYTDNLYSINGTRPWLRDRPDQVEHLETTAVSLH